jgi:hypothetical protein
MLSCLSKNVCHSERSEEPCILSLLLSLVVPLSSIPIPILNLLLRSDSPFPDGRVVHSQNRLAAACKTSHVVTNHHHNPQKVTLQPQ